MQYFDRDTDDERYPDEIAHLLGGLLHNRQLFDEDDGDGRPFVTNAVKYARERQDRRDSTPYDGDNEFVSRVVDIFDFPSLDFQADSWETVERMHRETQRRAESTAAILSAPTGFGKTEAFLGGLYQLLLDGRQSGVAIVYPRNALLQDQLGRVLEHVHRIEEQTGNRLSVGLYTGGQPWKNKHVGSKRYVETSVGGSDRLSLTNCWCGGDGETHTFNVTRNKQGYDIECEHDPSHSFDHRDLILPRKQVVFGDQPDILLTTLESLESFALKPNYGLLDHLDAVVLDEVHLYTQLRGAHAANIVRNVVRNVDAVSEDPLQWIGSSATIDDPERFGRRIFGTDDDNRIDTLEPPDSDYDDSHEDHVHYYFAQSPDDFGVSSMAIQQLMLLGHTLTGPDEDGQRGKVLSFIDSISQVNQKSSQFANADATRQLWQYHCGSDDVEDWPAVASSFGREFVDEPLTTTRVYADEGFDAETAAESDLLLSTSFLEVGIDVGDINVVTQYRTPWDLSSFQQRAGRAGREEGTDAHVVVFLSNLTGDANMFYRAGRFLDSDIRTPLKTDNPVVEWIHGALQRYNQCATEVYREYQKGFTDERTEHEDFLDRFLRDELGYDAVFELLTDPQSFFDGRFDRPFEVPRESLLSEQLVGEASKALTELAEREGEEIKEIESYFGMDDGTVVRGSEAVQEYVFRVRDRILDLVKSYRGQVGGYVSKIEDAGEDAPDAVGEVRSSLKRLQSETTAITGDASTAEEAVDEFSGVVGELFGLVPQLMEVQRAADKASDETVPDVDTQQLNDAKDAIGRLDTLQSDDKLERHYDRQTEVYYLQSALGEFEEYLGLGETSYRSLYAVKHLLRGCYYVYQYLEVAGEEPTEEVWFVPPDYFGSSGQFITVFDDENGVGGDQESIDSIVNTYAPYRSEYQSNDSTLQAFLPRTEVTDDGTVQFNYSNCVEGREREGILIPDSIQLTEFEDLAGEEAQNIVQYCPTCYNLTDGKCLRHDTYKEGKIHAEPEVATQVTDLSVETSVGDLALADLSPTVTLQGVTLEITPARPMYIDGETVYQFGDGQVEQQIESPERPLGFNLSTRGLVFDVEPFLDSLGEDVRSLVKQYQRDEADVSFEYVVYHTTAHFFLQLVSDVSSVNTANLLYGFDEDAGEVYVFEQTEGGQGIVDLTFEEIGRDPASVLESLVRVGYNAQVLTERLWADESFVETVRDGSHNEDDIRAAVVDALDAPFEDVRQQVTQEVLATVDRCHQLSSDTSSLSLDEAFAVKHTVAAEQIAGEQEYPEAAVEDAVDAELDHNRLKTLFHSPDVDDCVENLHLSGCIAGVEQGDALSYVVVEALRDHLTASVDTAKTVETMFRTEAPPAAEFDATSIFLDF